MSPPAFIPSFSRFVFRNVIARQVVALLLIGGAVPEARAAKSVKTAPAQAEFEAKVLPLLQDYCFECHGDGANKGSVSFDDYAKDGKLVNHDLWLKVLRNVRAGAMPPSNKDQPSGEDRALLYSWIKDRAFELDAKHPDPGQVTVRRLNRGEYRNTVKDLLGVDFDTDAEFPADDTGFGFDNIGSVLTVSPTLLEKLLDAAQKVVATAVPAQPYVVAERSLIGREFQRVKADGTVDANNAPDDPGVPAEFIDFLGKGAVDARYQSFYEASTARKIFTAEAGTYEFSLDLQTAERFRFGEQIGPDKNRCKVFFKIDGQVLAEQEFQRSGQKIFSLPAKADLTKGEHVLEFVVEPIASNEPQTRGLRMRFNEIDIKGPLQKEHWVRPPNYQKFFGDGLAADPKARRANTAKMLRDFATRAYRRPVDDNTVDRLVAVAEKVAGQRDQTYEGGVAQAIVAVLASPRFVFREEVEMPLKRGEKYPLIDEYSLASRLSYFLWSSMPDEELFQLARQGKLRANLTAQYDRMLADPKFSRFVSDFTGQWLQARDAANVVIDPLSIFLRDKPDPAVEDARVVFRSLIERDPIGYSPEEAASFDKADKLLKKMERTPKPQLNARLRRAMKQETEMFFAAVVKEDRSVLEFLKSDYTFLNEDLAKHYGIPDVKGPLMRKVMLAPDSPRGGVLTQATVLAVTSNPTRTSPVKRGVFILDNILGLPAAPPPPNIPALEAVASPEEIKKMTMRQQIAVHAENGLCRSCHNRMDPLGLALDNFNALGVWRDSEFNQPIDPSGKLISGETFAGIRELKDILVTSRRADFYHCLSEKLLTYALGRGMEYSDTTLLDDLVQRLDQSGGKMSTLLKGVIESAAFQQRRPVTNVKLASAKTPASGSN